jgi:cytochrome subunit of sulfide dehydrogenase
VKKGGAVSKLTLTALAAATLLLPASAFAQAAQPGPSGATIARTCYICHGFEAKSSAGQFPQLNNKAADYISTALLDFKADRKKGTIMNRIAKGYSEADIKAVAQYISSLK